MDPLAFLERPARWLEAVTRFGGTHTTSPSFGFALAVKQIPEDEWARLSSATVPTIWKGIVEDASIPVGTPVVSMAFGPGLTAAAHVAVKVGPR